MLRKNIIASVLALLSGAKFLPHARSAGYMRFFDKADDGKGGGAPAASSSGGTLEEQLTKARNDLATATDQVTSLTKERDTAVTNAANLKQQFDSLQSTATTAQNELVTTKNALTAEQNAHTATKSTLTEAQNNVSRLEKLCGLKGIDINSTVENQQKTEGNLTQAQWAERVKNAANLTERAKILGEFEAAVTAGKIAK